jgi:molybdopterin-binding protein
VAIQRALDICEETRMRISARNQLKGSVVEVKKGATTSHVRVDIGGRIMTSSITNEAVDDLGIKIGDHVTVVIKASDVMIAVD